MTNTDIASIIDPLSLALAMSFYSFLPIIVDQPYPALKEKLLITQSDLVITGNLDKKILSTIHDRASDLYFIICPLALAGQLDKIAKIQIGVDLGNFGLEFINLLCTHYSEDPWTIETWQRIGFEVATDIEELIHWY